MKITAEYSESIEVVPGLWRKIGIIIENNPSEAGGDPDPQLLHNQAKEYVQRWHKEAGVQPNKYEQALENYAPSTPPIIDRSIERLEILIDDCKTIHDLGVIRSQYDKQIKSTDSLINIYKSKLEELSK